MRYVYGQLQWVNFNFISNSKVQMKRSKITESDISASDENGVKDLAHLSAFKTLF